mmetsp:Transcript_2030/g.3165  ORF Transcript_2030/g.3165 Transcript_2030/m.3165 type:complete len:134 (-) Transcript_2030:586-987(-)|eukprot:CAMPEP_0119102086 /NCGR_PEP_ID=MMETSP1180-20130426/952_1 /TAXON_ID=3052 ORGANISM="Chlamydomonas cf sp, Strain CCMP681" /NCGR_SAMPLE_ID=MMETSP1180 /ASSEMBLY_ACC=CAM_ASM_000741 /LENGTH=133 /DNA_ID=CAMNT_0007086311 /DNA_START=205 /DNA_END=606 /DNA_ORIENTATION=+
MSGQRERVLGSLRQLYRLIQRLPLAQKQMALQEARATTASRRSETSQQTVLHHMKELAAKLAYLRVITPRHPGDAAKAAGRYVLREGQLVEGSGESAGSRAANGTTSREEALRGNAEHFKRFYGADKPKSMFF